MTLNSEVTVNVRAVSVGGAGVGEVMSQSDGRSDLLGITAFVPFSAPGEVVSARVTLRKKRHIEAQLLDVNVSSPKRTQAPCPHYETCGGCELQHLSYDAQVEAKFEMLKGALKVARLSSGVVDLLSPVVATEAYGYRRRVTLHINTSGQVGFYRAKTRSVVPIRECPVLVPELESLLPSASDFAREVGGRISSITLESDRDGTIVVLRSPYDLGDNEKKLVMQEARKFFSNVTLISGEKEVDGFGRQILELSVNDGNTAVVRVPAGAFSQVNWEINKQLVSRILTYSEAGYAKRIYDLYAGAGNFAFPLARAGADVIAIESDSRLVTCGRENASVQNLRGSLEFRKNTVEKFLARDGIPEGTHAIVADPPRSGLGSFISSLTNAKRLLLVSCHLPSFVRDLKAITQSGWTVKAIEPFDMFPQTSYLEILSVFESNV